MNTKLNLLKTLIAEEVKKQLKTEKKIFLTMIDLMAYMDKPDIEVIEVQREPAGSHYKYILTFTKK